jgi:two-component system KDP operon response regulator KdpE
MSRILIASTEPLQRRDLRTAVEADGHAVTEVVTAQQAIDETRFAAHDILIVDSCIAGSDFPNLCRRIRSESDLGIIALIRDDATDTRVDALNAGADDYLPERFAVPELLARVRAILRRMAPATPAQHRIPLGDRVIDLRAHKIHGPDSQTTHLTPKEFLVLKCLISRAGHPVTSRDLAHTVWHRDGSGDLEYVRVVIGQLRRKLEADHNRPQHILTERSTGYRFETRASVLTPEPSVSTPERREPDAYKTDSLATVR